MMRPPPPIDELSIDTIRTLSMDAVQKASSRLARGGYVLCDPEDGSPEVILIVSGSEVPLAVEAHEKLAAEGIRAPGSESSRRRLWVGSVTWEPMARSWEWRPSAPPRPWLRSRRSLASRPTVWWWRPRTH